jgi:DNA-binding MarR family transcriptional regulator/ribosomal protein S18 acetylase RimI-like enzyme
VAVDAVRQFSRFYTNVIGVLREGLLDTPYTLTESRVIYELAQRESTEVAGLRRTLDVDPGYMSRILAAFDADGLVTRSRSARDGRRQVIALTRKGRAAFATLNARSAQEIRQLLAPLPQQERARLVEALGVARRLLGDPLEGRVALRAPRAGDYGWVVERHGALYLAEYEWDETFEGLVAAIVGGFAHAHDPDREHAWIAELAGVRVGCVFCVQKSPDVGQLRLLLVEPIARGHGVGTRLVDACVEFARGAGYRELALWTNDVLHAARRIYERAGFRLVDEGRHHSFGHDLVEQTWSLQL